MQDTWIQRKSIYISAKTHIFPQISAPIIHRCHELSLISMGRQQSHIFEISWNKLPMWTSVTSGLAYQNTWVEGGHLLKLVTHHMTKRRQGSQNAGQRARKHMSPIYSTQDASQPDNLCHCKKKPFLFSSCLLFSRPGITENNLHNWEQLA